MASHSVKLAGEINVSNISFGDPKSMGNGGKILYINYDGGDLKLQTPEVRLPFDVSEFKAVLGGLFGGSSGPEFLYTAAFPIQSCTTNDR